MTEQTKTSITTWSGQWFDILKPEDYKFSIEEIAHALSNLCRYTGHVNKFYSVAEHSVLVSRVVPDDLALCGLLHDASEAYLGDVSSPLKALLPNYKQIETDVEKTIASQFDLPFPYPKEIKEADVRMYWQERQSIANTGVRDNLWHQDKRASRKAEAQGMNPYMAKRMFLGRYKEIMNNGQKKESGSVQRERAAQAAIQTEQTRSGTVG